MLASIKAIRTFFIERKYLNSEVQIANAQYTISDTLHDILSSDGQIEVSCNNLRSIVAEKSGKRDLSNGGQHDCQEFHVTLVDCLEKEFQEAECQPGLELMKMFYGDEVRQRVYVDPCARRCRPDDVPQKFSNLSLNVVKCRSGIKLETLIKDHFDKGDNLEMRCGCTPFNRQVQVTTQIVRAPDVLIIDLKRSEFPGNLMCKFLLYIGLLMFCFKIEN